MTNFARDSFMRAKGGWFIAALCLTAAASCKSVVGTDSALRTDTTLGPEETLDLTKYI